MCIYAYIWVLVDAHQYLRRFQIENGTEKKKPKSFPLGEKSLFKTEKNLGKEMRCVSSFSQLLVCTCTRRIIYAHFGNK